MLQSLWARPDRYDRVICIIYRCITVIQYITVSSRMCDSAEHGSRVASSYQTLQFFMWFTYYFAVFHTGCLHSYCLRQTNTLSEIGSVAHRKPHFEFLNAGALFTNTAAEPFVWATRAQRRKHSQKRGKRADVLVRLRRCAFRPPLPTILLSASHTNKKQATAALFASQKPGCLQWFQTQPSSSRGSPCIARTERKSSQGNAKVGVSVSILKTRGVMKRAYILLNPSAPLIWNFICFCVDHSGYQGNLQWS